MLWDKTLKINALQFWGVFDENEASQIIEYINITQIKASSKFNDGLLLFTTETQLINQVPLLESINFVCKPVSIISLFFYFITALRFSETRLKYSK